MAVMILHRYSLHILSYHFQVWGNQWAVVRDPNTFPDPMQFKPKRFLNENGEVIRHENLIQFGLGLQIF